jgi:hypothetical protein
MSNPFEEITRKLDTVLSRLASLEQKSTPLPTRIPLKDFCREYGISRVTAYAWNTRGLISLEKVSGRQYVRRDTISLVKKYQREPIIA